MRILFSANALWANSGYGVQAKHLLPAFQKMGHEVAQHAWFGLQGGVLNLGGIKIYPMGLDQYGNDIIESHAKDFNADIVISLMDAWVLKDYGAKAMRWIPYMPIDHDPIPPGVLHAIQNAYRVISYAQFGEKLLNDAGVKNTLIPHGVDCAVYAPRDKRAAKEKLKFDPDAFVIGMVAANKGFPSRKAFPENLQAVALFKERYPNVKTQLYLHTFEGVQMGGVDLNALLANLGFKSNEVTFCNQYQYISGMMTDEYMANAYNAMDVLLGASMSEGFGIPLIEAQACGTPVIAGDYTSMSELVFAGFRVKYAQKFWTPLNAWNYLPDIEQIVTALQWAEQDRGNEATSIIARAGAQDYDWDLIIENGWKPFLDEIQAELNAPSAHIHKWYPTGLYNDEGALCAPCKDKTCEAELQIKSNGDRVIMPHGFKTSANGVTLEIDDDPDGGVWKIVLREIEQDYDFDSIPFEEGDVVLDIGAHVGIVSMYLAKRFPFLKIHAFEPVSDNFKRLLHNLDANNIPNVYAYRLAVTCDGREVTMLTSNQNSGAARFDLLGTEKAESITLANIFQTLKLDRVKLLKIDAEGAEWEILNAYPRILEKVDYLRGEVHNIQGKAVMDLTASAMGERAKWVNAVKKNQR